MLTRTAVSGPQKKIIFRVTGTEVEKELNTVSRSSRCFILK